MSSREPANEPLIVGLLRVPSGAVECFDAGDDAAEATLDGFLAASLLPGVLLRELDELEATAERQLRDAPKHPGAAVQLRGQTLQTFEYDDPRTALIAEETLRCVRRLRELLGGESAGSTLRPDASIQTTGDTIATLVREALQLGRVSQHLRADRSLDWEALGLRGARDLEQKRNAARLAAAERERGRAGWRKRAAAMNAQLIREQPGMAVKERADYIAMRIGGLKPRTVSDFLYSLKA